MRKFMEKIYMSSILIFFNIFKMIKVYISSDLLISKFDFYLELLLYCIIKKYFTVG